MDSPVNDQYRTIVQDSGDPGYINRLMIGTATTGNVRIEWVNARYGQIIPTNWSMVQMISFMNSYFPLRYEVANAQNLIVKECLDKNFEWLLFLEHDTIIPPDAFIRFNDYIREKKYPVVSGLYFTRSRPSEPIVYRGRGNSFYTGWKMGDKVMVDGVPTGCLLVHAGILRAMWEESEEYAIGNIVTRRVFETPNAVWFDPESGQYNTKSGTSDLEWCSRVIEGGFFKKAGWDDFDNMKFPFLLDSGIFCKHINPDGEQFP